MMLCDCMVFILMNYICLFFSLFWTIPENSHIDLVVCELTFYFYTFKKEKVPCKVGH